jgi:hypothetical protein
MLNFSARAQKHLFDGRARLNFVRLAVQPKRNIVYLHCRRDGTFETSSAITFETTGASIPYGEK